MENYESLGVIGEGTYGVVIRARHRESGQVVAIKKFKESDEDEQVRKTSLREVRVLKQLRHPNIITLLEVFRRKGKLYLVFEYVEKTILEVLEARPQGLDENDVRRFTYQLLRGVEYCHAHNVMHRDIKPENILISKNGTLKLCDFGFARTMSVGGKYTDYVATRWYRSPELLVGDVEYTKGVDIWAIGCIFAEISNGMPLFPGDSDVDQLSHIMKCFGRLTTRQVQTFRRNPLYVGVELPNPREHEPLDARFPTMPRAWLQIIKSCLKNDPEQRDSCTALMNQAYFTDNGFREDFEQELRLLFEKEERQLQAIAGGSRASKQHTSSSNKTPTDPSTSQNGGQEPSAPMSVPGRGETPTIPGITSHQTSKTQQPIKPAQSAQVPSIGTLWSQYLSSTNAAATATGQVDVLPDLGAKVQNLQTQHPLFNGTHSSATTHGGLYYRSSDPNNGRQPQPQAIDPLGGPASYTAKGTYSLPPSGLSSHQPQSHHYQTQPASNPSLTMTSTAVNRSYLPPSSQQGARPAMFPTLTTSGASNANANVANASLGLSYKKKPAKKNVLSTVNLTTSAYGGPAGGTSSPPPGNALGANPYALGASNMVLHGHNTGSYNPPQSQQGPRRTASKGWM